MIVWTRNVQGGPAKANQLIYRFPLVPGYETVGVVAAFGSNVKGFKVGDYVVADNSELCGKWHYCRRGDELFGEHSIAYSVMVDGGCYAVYPSHRVFQFHNISDADATLIESAACAAHGMDRIAPKLGSKVLLFGAGPTGLVLAQMLRLYGASHLVIDAPGGPEMDLVRSLGGHSTVQMNMSNFLVPKKQRKRLVRTYKARTCTV